MNYKLSKEQKIKLQKPLYKKLIELDMTWKEVSDFLGYSHQSAISNWHEKEEVPLSRVLQVKLFLETIKKEK
jgi:hypothetical protein